MFPPQRQPCRTAPHTPRHARCRRRPPAQHHRAPAWSGHELHPARRSQGPAARCPSPPPCFSRSKPRPEIFRHGLRLPGSDDKDFARRLRKGAGADPTASGATRVAGSLNFKDKYAPAFPRVTIHAAQPGRITTRSRARSARSGRAAGNCASHTPSPARATRPGRSRKWPSYERCLDGAPLNSEETGPDTSRADFVWCMTAITWGWASKKPRNA